jgi:CBS domain-containing protein
MPNMTREPAIAFANQLRSARLVALGDAESFDGIVHVVERIGSYLAKERLGDLGKDGSLYKYSKELADLASNSGMAAETPHRFPILLTPFGRLYDLVTAARNDALHQGAFARQLTGHAIELAIILEDALNNHLDLVVTDFMVRNPVCAEPWQPVGFIRQQMLANSYSYLPMFGDDGNWHVVSDAAVARFVGPERKGEGRRRRLASALREASVSLMEATFVDERASLHDAFNRLNEAPVLLVKNSADPKGLLGILTAFDLL